jgi:hypothetical protein
MEIRDIFCNTVASRVGYPYIWGARGPDRFDCCGLVEWAMAKIGRPFTNAKGTVIDIRACDLLDIFHKNKVIKGCESLGSLYLFSSKKNPAQISHVCVYFRKWKNGKKWLIGANGGGSINISESIAFASGAMVKVVPDTYRETDMQFIVDPFLGET